MPSPVSTSAADLMPLPNPADGFGQTLREPAPAQPAPAPASPTVKLTVTGTAFDGAGVNGTGVSGSLAPAKPFKLGGFDVTPSVYAERANAVRTPAGAAPSDASYTVLGASVNAVRVVQQNETSKTTVGVSAFAEARLNDSGPQGNGPLGTESSTAGVRPSFRNLRTFGEDGRTQLTTEASLGVVHGENYVKDTGVTTLRPKFDATLSHRVGDGTTLSLGAGDEYRLPLNGTPAVNVINVRAGVEQKINKHLNLNAGVVWVPSGDPTATQFTAGFPSTEGVAFRLGANATF